MEPLPKVRLLGINVWAGDRAEFLSTVLEMVGRRVSQQVTYLNMNGAWHYHRDERFRQFLAQADLVYLDGAPLSYWGRWLGKPISFRNRHTAIDFFPHLFLELERRGIPVFFLGGSPEDQPKIRHWVERHFPGLRFGSRSGYFDPQRETPRVLKRIHEFGPALLMVGMGMPQQEHWVAENADQLPSTTCFCVGAAFEYFIGKSRPAPRAMGRWGLEWLWRWLGDPIRFTGRYFVYPFFLLPHFWKDWKSRREVS